MVSDMDGHGGIAHFDNEKGKKEAEMTCENNTIKATRFDL